MTFEPRLDILPAPQRQLWPELATIAPRHVLYGGTALALRLGHRESIDFDFFSHDDLEATELDALPWLRGSTMLQESANTRTVLVERGGPIKISFFGAIRFGRVGEPETTADGTLRVASMEDLGGTKIKALLQRIEAKDYRDVEALIRSGIPLSRILGAAQTLFGPSFNSLVARKALCYFEGGDLDTLDASIRERLIAEATRAAEDESLALRASRLD